MSKQKYIVVIGTSAGGIRALEELVFQFTPEMDAAFLLSFTSAEKGWDKIFYTTGFKAIPGSPANRVQTRKR